jgi:hypothetical protein
MTAADDCDKKSILKFYRNNQNISCSAQSNFCQASRSAASFLQAGHVDVITNKCQHKKEVLKLDILILCVSCGQRPYN